MCPFDNFGHISSLLRARENKTYWETISELMFEGSAACQKRKLSPFLKEK